MGQKQRDALVPPEGNSPLADPAAVGREIEVSIFHLGWSCPTLGGPEKFLSSGMWIVTQTRH